MSKLIPVVVLALALFVCSPAFAIDGQILINQAIVTAAGGFPYKITQPGSYKLSGNLVVTAENTDAIDISTSNVTLDLNGFSITGPITCTGQGSGLSCSNGASTGVSAFGLGTTIKNGTVSGFNDGVFIENGIVDGIQAYFNTNLGIEIQSGLATGNVALANGNGIYVINGIATGNFATYNEYVGLTMLFGLYGSNRVSENGNADLLILSPTAVSQNNNSCSTGVC